MAVDFLSPEQKTQYGQFSEEPNEVQLARYFHLDQTDLDFIMDRRGDHNRLGFALQITSCRFLGTFISDLSLVPAVVINFIAQQLFISDLSVLNNYARREVTKHEHMEIIQGHYGYHDFHEAPWKFRLTRLLYARSWVGNERPSLMFDFATSWLIQNKVLLPGATTLSRLISEIRERANNLLWRRLASLPTEAQKKNLETLLEIAGGVRNSRFDRYRKGPVSVSSLSFNESVERYKELKEFGLQGLNFSRIPSMRLKNLARYASVISINKIGRMPEDKRIAMLVAFIKVFEVAAIDDALDVLDLLITGITGAAKKIGQKKRLRTLKDLDRSAITLADVVLNFILDEAKKEEGLRKIIFSKIPKEKLMASVTTIHSLARPEEDKFNDEIVEQYGKVRRFMPQL